MAESFKVRKQSAVTGHAGVIIDASDLKNLGKALQAKGMTEVSKALRKRLVAVAKDLEYQAKIEAAQHSSSIPHTIRGTVSGGTIALRAGVKKPAQDNPTAHKGYAAAPMEDTDGKGKFRHPVFGNRKVWVTQNAHPYLAPTIKRNVPMIEEGVKDAILIAMRGLGFE